jgi:cytoskeletal protein CcmA (bactofilin family)
MGIKDNFQQALRELTGTEKEDKREKQIDAMKSAVAAGDTSEFEAIRDTGDGSSFEEIERRAAAAADEYNRQQSAFASSQHIDGSNIGDVPPMPQDVQPSAAPSQQAAPNMSYQQPAQNAAYQQPAQNAGYQQSAQNAAYQQPAQNAGYQQTPNMGGGYQRGAATAGDPAASQAVIFNSARYQHPQNDDDEITVISKNTVIDGNVRSFANMSVDGNVKGNIETTKDIDLNGKVVGNIACNNAQMRTSQIQGNIQMKGNAYMERDTLLIGDLTSTYANVNGKIKGNLDITGKAELKGDAVVFGDISASTITVNDGAIIQGYVSTTFLNKEESKNIFPDTITIGD